MTDRQTTYKKSLIQKIQIVKHNVFADDEMRKEFMLSRFGVDSTTKLSIDELKLLLDFCNRNVSDIPLCKVTEAQLHKMYEIWFSKARIKNSVSLLNFACKIAKRDIYLLENMRKDEATNVIIALKKLKA
jgi:hypothetical protein